ncbi:MAG TPA: glycosyltransferase family 1 protein, partial [Gammaproteobacteria bacterium]|nr:glycosyltransferase family 1 protein [Gammaproteobacteria bacterium]
VIDQIKILNAKGNVHWLNYISTPELRCLYQSASIFLLPSLHEGFGLPILEAFASSTPVITSNIFAMPEVAGDAAWLVDPYDIESIREGMLSLLSDSTKRDRFIALGSERVKQFTWDNCRKNTLAVYKKVLGVKC